MKQIGKLIKQYFFKKSKFHGNWKIISIILFSLSFLGKFGQKIRIVCWRWNLAFRVIQICLIRWWCSPSVLERKYRFWENLVQKIKIVCFWWYLTSYLLDTYSNMLNLMGMFNFSILSWIYYFSANWVRKIKTVSDEIWSSSSYLF